MSINKWRIKNYRNVDRAVKHRAKVAYYQLEYALLTAFDAADSFKYKGQMDFYFSILYT